MDASFIALLFVSVAVFGYFVGRRSVSTSFGPADFIYLLTAGRAYGLIKRLAERHKTLDFIFRVHPKLHTNVGALCALAGLLRWRVTGVFDQHFFAPTVATLMMYVLNLAVVIGLKKDNKTVVVAEGKIPRIVDADKTDGDR